MEILEVYLSFLKIALKYSEHMRKKMRYYSSSPQMNKHFIMWQLTEKNKRPVVKFSDYCREGRKCTLKNIKW